MSSSRDNRPCQLGHDPYCPLGPDALDVVLPASSSAASIPSITIAYASSTATASRSGSSSYAGTIAGSVVGGVVFLLLIVLGILVYLRARKRKRTPPSSEFMNSIRAGDAPVLRLDSGAEYTPALAEKGAYTSYPPAASQSSYCTSPMKFADETILDTPSGRPSVERLQPQRYSSQRPDSFLTRHHPGTSIGSRRELWGSETEMFSSEFSPVRRSPVHTDSMLHFTPRYSLDGISSQSSPPSRSPPSLHPLRRPEGT